MLSEKNLHEGNVLYLVLKSAKKKKKLVRKKSGSAFTAQLKIRKGVQTIGSCFRFTKWNNVVAAKIIGGGPE